MHTKYKIQLFNTAILPIRIFGIHYFSIFRHFIQDCVLSVKYNFRGHYIVK